MNPTRRIDLAWLILVLATTATWMIGDVWQLHPEATVPAMAAVLAFTAIKCRLVALDFMALRSVKLFWRGLVLGWVALVLGLVTLTYWLSL